MRNSPLLRVMPVLASLTCGPALAQEGDPGVLTRFLQDNLSSAGRTVTIDGFRGALSSRASIAEMRIADGQGVWLTLRGVTLDWNRSAIFRGQVEVTELSAQEIIVARPPVTDATLPPPEAQGFALPNLPVSVSIDRIAATRIELGAPVLGQAVEGTLEASLQLAGGEGETRLTLLRTDDGPAGSLTLEGSYSNDTRLLILDLDAREGAEGIAATALGLPGRPETQFTVAGEGSVDDFAAEIRLATDGVDRLVGSVTAAQDDGGRSFSARLGGNPAPLFLPQYAEFFGSDVGLDLAGRRSTDGALDIERLALETAALDLDGSLALDAAGLPQRFALRGVMADPTGASVLLPTGGQETRVDRAEIDLSFDASRGQDWTGQASLVGLEQADFALDRTLLTGSGTIRRQASGNAATVALRLLASGIAPRDPDLARAIGPAATGSIVIDLQEGAPLRLSDVVLQGDDYSIRTQGEIGGLASGIEIDGRIEAEVADLARFSGLAGRPLGGRASFQAEGQGSLLGGDLDLAGTVEGQAIQVGQPQADALLRETSRIAFSVLRDATGTTVRQLDVTATGASVRGSGTLRSAGNDLQAVVAFDDLGVLGPQFRGSLTGNAGFTGTAETGAVTLEATARELAVGQAAADRLLAGTSTLSVAVGLEAGAVQLRTLRLANPQLTVSATGSAEGNQRDIAIDARLANLAVILPDFPGPLTVSGTASDRGQAYRIDLGAKGPGQIDTRVAGTVARDGTSADLTMTGTAQAALVNPFIAPRSVSGPVRFDLRLAGPPRLGSLSGSVALTNGQVAAPVLRLSLDGVSARADLGGGRATISAEARNSAGGTLAVAGSVGLAAPNAGDLTVTLRNLVLRDPELYETEANGAVRLNGPLTGGALISGALTLSGTELRVPSTGLGGSGPIPELVHLDEPAAVRATRQRAGLIDSGTRAGGGSGRPFGLDLTINAPSQVFLRGRGLDAELAGSVRLTGTTANVIPSGGVDLVRGRLDILGRRLDLTEGNLRIEGNLNPTLRVAASNTAEGITSSVLIEGPVSEPEISFTSVPELPEEEVLAHLLFGRQLTSLSALQAAQLANAVAQLAGRGGEGIIESLRRGFGLDDLDLVTADSGETSLRLGRYVSEKVYTEVIVGTEGTSELNLNLDVRPGVTVRGSADSEGDTGIGVFVERDY